MSDEITEKDPKDEQDETDQSRGRKRVIVSEDVPLLTFTGVATAFVLQRFGAASTLLGVGLAVVLADLLKNFARSRGWKPLRLYVLTFLLLGVDKAYGARGRTRKPRRAPAPRPRARPRGAAAAMTAAVSLVLALGFFGVPQLAVGEGGPKLPDVPTAPVVQPGGPPPPDLPPRITVPADRTVLARGPVVFHYTATAVDDGRVVTPSCTPPSGATFPLGRTTVTCRAGNGNAASAFFHVTVRKAPGPLVLTLPAALMGEASGPHGTRVPYRATAADLAGAPARIACRPRSGALFPLGRTTVRCTAAKGAARASGTIAVVVRDTRPPRLAVPADRSLQSGRPEGRAVTFPARALDAVDGAIEVVCAPRSGSIFAPGTTTVRCSARDARGNRGERRFRIAVVLVDDRTAPRLELAGATAQATSSRGAVVRYEASASDDRDEELRPRCSRPSGTTFPVGSTTIRCEAVDSAGNRTFRSATVKVVDTTPPRLGLPAPIRAEGTGPAGSRVRFSARSSDLVGGAVPARCAPASGAWFPLGRTNVACWAVDRSGNRSRGGFTVTVADTTPPRVTIDAPATVEATSAAGADVAYTVSASDLVGGSVTPTCSRPPGTFPLGRTEVSCSAADASGNRADASAIVAVVDTTPPRVTIDAPATIEATSAAGAEVAYAARATDLVGGSLTPTCSRSPGTFSLGRTEVSCSAADTSGNRADASATVAVVDTTSPAVRIEAPARVETSSPAGAVVRYDATASDSVSGSLEPTCTPSAETFPLGETTITCSATDGSGNVGRATAVVAVTDTTPPELRLRDQEIVAYWNGRDAFELDLAYEAGATDTVDPRPRLGCDPERGSPYRVAGHTRSPFGLPITCTATDRSGNAATARFTLFIHLRFPGPN